MSTTARRRAHPYVNEHKIRICTFIHTEYGQLIVRNRQRDPRYSPRHKFFSPLIKKAKVSRRMQALVVIPPRALFCIFVWYFQVSNPPRGMTFPRKTISHVPLMILVYLARRKKNRFNFRSHICVSRRAFLRHVYTKREQKSRTWLYARNPFNRFIFFEALSLLYSQCVTWVLIERQMIVRHRKVNRVPVFLKICKFHARYTHGGALSLPAGKGDRARRESSRARKYKI